MRLNVQSLAITTAVLFGGSVLLVGSAHVIWPGYGSEFLSMAASIYPGYSVGGFGSVIVGTLYAALDGAIGGAILAWLYNRLAASSSAPAS